MGNKFNGSIKELKDLTSKIDGNWSTESGKHVFRSKLGAVLNWWESNRTLLIQGKQEGKVELENAIGSKSSTESPVDGQEPNIFIVHGHDTTARDQLELVLRRLNLEPFVLMNSSGEGKTIIEALEGQIGRNYSADFGIVMMTPDDFGYSKKEGSDKAEPRARQNVILETGMLLSSLTRSRMAIIVKGHVEIPSDLQGIIRFEYNDHIKEIVPKLCKRLKEAGFKIESEHMSAAIQ